MHELRTESVSQEDKIIAALIYIISFFTAFIGPLIIWLLKKNSSSFVDFHGREYLNLFISYTVYTIIATILVIIFVGGILLAVIGVALTVLTIIGAVKAFLGEKYRFPLIFRLL